MRVEGERVVVPPGLKRGANRRLAGEDVRTARSCCRPAGGSSRRMWRWRPRSASHALQVRRRVRVAMFSTGDEIVEPGAPRPAAALYDANRDLLAACWSGWAPSDRSRHPARRSRKRLQRASRRRRTATISC